MCQAVAQLGELTGVQLLAQRRAGLFEQSAPENAAQSLDGGGRFIRPLGSRELDERERRGPARRGRLLADEQPLELCLRAQSP